MKVGIVVPNMLQAAQEIVYQSIGDKLHNGEVTAKIQQGGEDGRPHPDGRWEDRQRVREREAGERRGSGELVDPVPRLWRLGQSTSRVPVRREGREEAQSIGQGIRWKEKGKGLIHQGRTEGRRQGHEGIRKGRIQGILLPVRPAGAPSERVPNPLRERRGRGRGGGRQEESGCSGRGRVANEGRQRESRTGR